MKTALLVLCVAMLAAGAAFAAPQAAAPTATAPTPAPPALCSAADAPAFTLAATIGTPAMEPRIECSPLCSYYETFCQTLCTNRGGIKSFICTPPPPGECATYTCTCNKSL